MAWRKGQTTKWGKGAGVNSTNAMKGKASGASLSPKLPKATKQKRK